MPKKESEPIIGASEQREENFFRKNKESFSKNREWLEQNKKLILGLIRKEVLVFNKSKGNEYQEKKGFMPATTKFTKYIIARVCEELNISAYNTVFYEQFGSAIKQMYYDESKKEKIRNELKSFGADSANNFFSRQAGQKSKRRPNYKKAGRFIEMSQPRERE